MPYRDLREFIGDLDARGELRRIEIEVDPHLEITEIADRVMKAGGPALLFENVRGSRIPLAINLLGSPERMTWALGLDDWSELETRIEKLLDLAMGGPPQGLRGKLQAFGEILRMARIGPTVVNSGPVHELVETENPSLAELPIPTCWPLDGGPYITMPLVFTHDPASGKRNIGMYRLQKFDDQTLGMHWQLHKGGAEHWRRSQEEHARMEVAVVIGAEPVLLYAATAPLPPDVDELVFAGFLRGSRVRLTRCKTIDVLVPASAEIVLEGHVEIGETRLEGPFGDHTGYYSLAEPYPVFHLSAVTRRKDPIYVSTIVGKPPMEDAWIGKATERLFLPLIRLFVPEIVDINLPVHGAFHNLAVVSIRKRYPGHARKVMHGLWGLGQMMFTKYVIVVDADVDVQNLKEVLWRVGANTDPARDLEPARGPMDTLEFATAQAGFGGKLGIDATRKLPEEGFPREWPPDIAMDDDVRKLVDGRWESYGI
jgi:4-hydroxy-3-polyprenylbenzoate decarboxylase